MEDQFLWLAGIDTMHAKELCVREKKEVWLHAISPKTRPLKNS